MVIGEYYWHKGASLYFMSLGFFGASVCMAQQIVVTIGVHESWLRKPSSDWAFGLGAIAVKKQGKPVLRTQALWGVWAKNRPPS